MNAYRQPTFALFALLLFGGLADCKKNSSSPNDVRFSLNGGAETVCYADIRPNYDFLGGANCEFQFDRTGGTTSSGSADIGVFVENDCSMVKGPLPYQTTHFRFGLIVNVPYSYPFNGVPGQDSLGHMILTITGRSSNRVVGTISGIIYRSDIGYADSATLNCSFDLNMPVTM
jgi:hypothetical protein